MTATDSPRRVRPDKVTLIAVWFGISAAFSFLVAVTTVLMLFGILLPLCRAPLLTVGMFTFIGSWNALAWPLLVTNTPDWRPISVGLQQFVSEAGAEVHLQMAGAVIATVPVLLIYFLIQKEFTEGISMSGLKG